MKSFLKEHIFGLIILAPLFICSVAFTVTLALTGLFSYGVIFAVAILLVLLMGTVFLLTLNRNFKVRTIIGACLAALIIAVQLIGGYYIAVGVSTLNQITTTSVEYAELGIYVRTNDKAQEIADIKNYPVGILKALDRDITNLALTEIKEEQGFTPKTTEFVGLEELLDSLLNNTTTDAILINKAFLDLLEDTPGHEEDISKIRELCTIEVERMVANLVIPENINDKVFTVYFSGIDTFGSISKRSRSDVNIIATVNVETGQVLLVSTPRDYYVPLSISNGMPDKLTHAGIYGIDVSIDTLEMLYDTNIDYYFRVNFDGFKDIIDALGGITVNSQYDFKVATYQYTKGENFLMGEAALHFARARKPVPGGDQTRGKHQMEVIKGVIAKMCSPSLLLNYTKTLDGIKGSFETSMPYDKVAKLVKNQLSQSTKWNVSTYSVTGTGATKKTYSLSLSSYVLEPDQKSVDKAKALMQQVRNGEVPAV